MLIYNLIFVSTCLLSVQCLEVKTTSGTVRGLTVTALNRNVNQYLNIPYGEPPVRFARPVPKKPVSGIIDGTEVGNSCYQNDPNANLGHTLVESEDCLALNVWSPSTANSSNPLPVMLWIHGGSYVIGSITNAYNGSLLAAHDVVIVTANYRLGMFGWLYIDDRNSNFGLYDQLLALEWVRENIASFGGDPNQITVFGESAGSVSTSAHILSPHARGLFSRAILESGAQYRNTKPLFSKDNAIETRQQMVSHFNCSGDQWLQCLRKVDAKTMSQYYGITFYYPIYGTDYLPMRAQNAFKNYNFSTDVDIMAGVMLNEGSYLAHLSYPESDNITSVDKFTEVLNSIRDSDIDRDKIKEFYLKNVDTSNATALRFAFYDFYGDTHMNCPTYLFAKQFAEESPDRNVFFYRWTHPGLLFTGCTKELGVCHASDLEYVFGTSVVANTPDKQFSMDIMKVWTNFAKNKRPFQGFSKDNEWPSLIEKSSNKTKIRELNPDSTNIFTNLFQDTCDGFWKDYFL